MSKSNSIFLARRRLSLLTPESSDHSLIPGPRGCPAAGGLFFMGETLGDWCRRAQDEQIHQGLGIVYGNYVASHHLGLITHDGYKNFQRGLSLGPPLDAGSLQRHEDRTYGLTAIAVDRAVSRLANDPSYLSERDFRLCGREFSYSGLLVSLDYSRTGSDRTATAPSSAPAPMAPKPRPTRPVRPAIRVKWLTRPAVVVRRLREKLAAAGDASMDDASFFAHLVAMLGLRPPFGSSDTAVCRLQLFELNAGATLTRPHALSRGYPERFCVVSPYGRFGATADNRDGKAGLPEALAPLTDLREISSSDPGFQELSAEICQFVDFQSGDAGQLSGQYDIVRLHDADDSVFARRTMTGRLRRINPATVIPCSAAGALGAICPRFSAGLP